MVTLSEKMTLLRGLLTTKMAYGAPFYVTIDITRRCNLQCVGCRFRPSQTAILASGDPPIMDISIHFVENLYEELSLMGIHTILLTGEGEPFLHPQLFDFISIAKERGFQVSLITNGTLLDKDKIQALIDSRLDLLTVSLWASSPEDYERNYPGTGTDSFRRVVDGLRLLTSCKAEKKSKLPMVKLHHPINRNNFERIDSIVHLAYATGCNAIAFSPFKSFRGELAHLALSQDQENFVRLVLIEKKKQLRSLPLGHNIDSILLRYRIGEAVWERLPCYIGWIHSRVKTDGTVFPCNNPCDLIMGNLGEMKFRDIWNSPTYQSFRKQTVTRQALTSIGKHCDCGFCCHVLDNLRVHRIFTWLAPFVTGMKVDMNNNHR